MAATSERARVAPGPISFELDRFEHVDGRLELSGRWFGVRGMRFVRPTLTSGVRRRVRRPRRWRTSSTSRGRRSTASSGRPRSRPPRTITVLDAELAVAPGIAIRLPAPGEELPDARPDRRASTPPALRRRRASAPRARPVARARAAALRRPAPSSPPCARRPSVCARSRSGCRRSSTAPRSSARTFRTSSSGSSSTRTGRSLAGTRPSTGSSGWPAELRRGRRRPRQAVAGARRGCSRARRGGA